MSAFDSFLSTLAMMSLALPALVVLGLVLRGTGGLHLSPIEGTFVAVAVSIAGVVRGAYGVFTIDEPIVAPMLLAMPIATGIVLGARVAVAGTAASWMLLIVLALANRSFASAEGDAVGVGPLVAAATVSVLAGLYAAAAARRSRALAMVPVTLMIVPALAHPSGPIADPNVWIGVVACGAWVVVLEAVLRTAPDCANLRGANLS